MRIKSNAVPRKQKKNKYAGTTVLYSLRCTLPTWRSMCSIGISKDQRLTTQTDALHSLRTSLHTYN